MEPIQISKVVELGQVVQDALGVGHIATHYDPIADRFEGQHYLREQKLGKGFRVEELGITGPRLPPEFHRYSTGHLVVDIDDPEDFRRVSQHLSAYFASRGQGYRIQSSASLRKVYVLSEGTKLEQITAEDLVDFPKRE